MEFRKFLIAFFIVGMITNLSVAKPLEGEDQEKPMIEVDNKEVTTDVTDVTVAPDVPNASSPVVTQPSVTQGPSIETTPKAIEESGAEGEGAKGSAPSFMQMKLIPFISVALLYATMSKVISI
ncbi:unnamed protein product [Chironomus riparius]|uniref:Uncharacterized protein n=1 Tax=Chironomus riparius TaxID=315576 RepID=A0A9N9RJE8_9DIPT|nr:unnamed protein product [Chironomus riparius]